MRKLIVALIIIAVVIAAGGYWHYNRLHPSTDDAYVKAHIVNIASQVSGRANQVLIKNHQQVSQGELLFTLEPKQFKIALQQAEAKLAVEQQSVQSARDNIAADQAIVAQKRAELTLAEQNAKRTLALVAKGQVSIAEGDQVRSQLTVAKAALQAAQESLKQARDQLGPFGDMNAQIRQAQADVDQAKLNLSHTKIYAAAAGILDQVSLRPGDTVTALQSQFALIENNEWWVDANFKETDIGRINVGQSANIVIDMYPGVRFKGKVASMSYGSGASFSLLPPENATGNWVKVTQRFPVKISFTGQLPVSYPLRVGSSATVTVSVSVSVKSQSS
ncbi:MFP transporter [Piscirickettsia salmonis]|uniref:Multidrug resistance protein MdtN n=1 Tax=Piscirickettsia salmonis TaxID=1238 RepID=A0A9Q6LJC5_PISSA|nr:HlyD family secretion protein [Piscirickettsia salmonis]ALA24280.1 MFP transporter [Piscirickettsia salmonis]APS44663.1 MFP transporter [Piscirickettsia salmonis]APS48023.1 MFP transporter [Piscirickettsia salmonis]APS51980.1 MFP transporter [Piscirickettsia salmonis]APS55197.1 MFP transporter [Piscirickettsia salmonis]